jgi:hypothetical protein
MTFSIKYASFMLRLWSRRNQELPQPSYEWQGEVEHIQSGQKWNFDNFEDLAAFLRQRTMREDESDAG